MSTATKSKPELPTGTILNTGTREAWLAARADYVGASEVAALFGATTWDSEYSLWAKKTGAVERSTESTIGMERGSKFEPILAEEVRESFGWQVWLWPQTDFVVHDDPDYLLGCTPDCLLDDGEGIALGDFKMCGEFQKKKWATEPPGNYQMQIQAQMAVTGIHRAYLLPAFGLHCEVLPIAVDYHPGFQAEMESRVKDFWRKVRDNEEPIADGKAVTFEALKSAHPLDDGTTQLLYDADSLAASDYERLTAEIKSLKTEQDIAKARLIQAIGDSTYAQTDAGLCWSYKHQDSRRIDTKRLRADHPEIAEECTKVSSTRVLRSVKQVPGN